MNNTSMREFLGYVLDFYGKDGLYSHFFKNSDGKFGVDATLASKTIKILSGLGVITDGDSLDRELFRDFALYIHYNTPITSLEYGEYMKKFIQNWYKNHQAKLVK